jgi:beta-lactamase regulating signal transducer with metallopeptidase domain
VTRRTAGRSFGVLAATSLGALALTDLGACALVSVAVYRAATGGPSMLAGNPALVPAAAFLVVVAAGAVRGLRSLRRQIVSSRALARRVQMLRLEPTAPLRAAAARAGLERRVLVVDCDEAFSFVFGVLGPRVAVSRGLLAATSAAELDAVLEHERYHVRSLDPLRVVLARALPVAVFYVPALAQLRDRYLTERELAADRHAVRRHGRGPLAGALLKVLRGPDWPELSAAAAIGGSELLGVRIEQLETGRTPALARLSLASVAVSIGASLALAVAFAAAAGGLGWMPGASMDSDTPGADVAMAAACLAPGLFGGLLAWAALGGRRAAR